MEIGFVILSHDNPRQLLRLVNCLGQSYERPPIAIHHDTHQTAIEQSSFPQWAHFVERPERTHWAQFSLVRSALRALDLLYSRANPGWFFLLSASDYPIRAARDVRTYLSSIKADALLDFRGVQSSHASSCVTTAYNPCLHHFDDPRNSTLAYERYAALNLHFPILRSRRIGRKTVYTKIKWWPFDLKPYYGDQWFAGNAKCARILLSPTKEHFALQRHLRLRTVPDECYYQTVLVNAPCLRIDRNTKRFCNWPGGAHPSILGLSDLPAIEQSGHFFARKFSPNSTILDVLDRRLGC